MNSVADKWKANTLRAEYTFVLLNVKSPTINRHKIFKREATKDLLFEIHTDWLFSETLEEIIVELLVEINYH